MTRVRGRITGAHRDTDGEGVLEHKLHVRLLPEDGASGDLVVTVSPDEYAEFARNFTSVFEVEVNLVFDKPTST